jgi:HSP20 family molecular chaperone IbpA
MEVLKMAEEKQTNEVKKIVPPVDIYETDNERVDYRWV